MTTSGYDQPAGARTGPGPDVKEQAQQVAGTAKEQGAHVAAQAIDEAQNVAAQAKEQAASLIDQTRQELEQQSRVQKDRLADTLRSFTDDLEGMLSGRGAGSGLAADLAREVAERTRGIARTVQEREPGELLDEVRGFARRKPGTFLLGALAAGVVVGRLSRAAKDAGAVGSGSGSTPSGVSTGPADATLPPAPVADAGTAAGDPLAGVSEGAVPPYPGAGAGTGAPSVPPAAPPVTNPGTGPYGGV